MDTAPLIIICIPTSEQLFAEKVAKYLSLRGIRVSIINEALQIQSLPSFAVICVGIVTQKQSSELVEAAIDAAQKAQLPIFPLILRDERDLPESLKETQWSDFSQSFNTGYLELLLALDMENLSCWPYNSSTFDDEVVFIRAQTGFILPSWQVYRALARLNTFVTRETISAVVLICAIFLFSWYVDRAAWIYYLLLGLWLSIGALGGLQKKSWHYSKDGPLVVITPQGFLNKTNRRVDSHSFASIEYMNIVESNLDIYASIYIKEKNGNYKLLIIPKMYDFRPGIRGGDFSGNRSEDIARKIMLAFQQSERKSPITFFKDDKPFIFVSYAHKDEGIVNSIEIRMLINGLETWIDRSRLRVGMQWQREIHSNIEQCSALVLLISPDSIISPYVRYEYEVALQLNKPVVGVLVKPCHSVPADLRSCIKADMRRGRFVDFLSILYALEKEGVFPSEMINSMPAFTLARAFIRKPLVGEYTYKAQKLSYLSLIAVSFLIFIILLLGLLFHTIIFFLAGISAVTFPFWLNETLKKEPDLINIYPNGVVQYTYPSLTADGASHFIDVKFSSTKNWETIRSDPLGGSYCAFQENGVEKGINIPASFHNHRQIAKRIIETFNQAQSSLSHSRRGQ